ncbi:hypothetical protein BCR37DRAFT_344009 [Protomyces lactucae-debilis]|uniref:Heme oxygenase n=1 Tax=Protomyces lactucae-debilis TaxID=2754530 RepID=A0A1Y2FSP6_PROLT|nr:uncharacterized protein BCR37DRAFT_344009 [Protomyces lactucae-debilis]ORY86334.1 hypothetical protein BCR37DRAFT_344009 [Protomyces lactucae-debilis]
MSHSSINDRIARETRAVHARNNRLANVKLLLALKSAAAFRAYIVPFYFVYKTFEAELAAVRGTSQDEATQHVFQELYEPLLERTRKIEQDLRFYYGPDADVVMRGPQTRTLQEYVEHIQSIAKQDPVKLLAYSSVMYLALFAGGQIIKSKMVKRYGFFPTKPGVSQEESIRQGTNIFTFDTKDVQTLKKAHRDRFDRVVAQSLTATQQDAIVAEAKEIFVRNEQLIAEVQVPGAAWITLDLLKWPLLVLLLLFLAIYWLRS